MDLFCGVGGLTHGFCLENFHIAAGIDTEEQCRFAFESNNNAPFICKDVAGLVGKDIHALYPGDCTRILIGCAPCQPFSMYNQKNNNSDWKLLASYAKLIRSTKPTIVSMENVPRLLKFRGGRVFSDFKAALDKLGYFIDFGVLYGPDYGLPQARSRLVLVASLLGRISLPKPTHTGQYISVKRAIGNLPRLKSGSVDASDPLHRASQLSAINLKRIRASRPGGTWRDWDKRLRAQCHQQDTGKGYSSVYGRMSWDEPAPTITTQFYGFGNGRFGHPEQNRALSLREGAILQGFPREYEFVAPGQPIQARQIGRMIGNAVPVVLGRVVAQQIKKHLKKHQRR